MQYSGHNTPLGHNSDRGPMDLGQYDCLGEYCGPHTASSVFLILVFFMVGPMTFLYGRYRYIQLYH